MKNKTNLYFLATIVLIILTIALVAILDRSKPSTTSTEDVRARAGTQSTLTLLGTVDSVNEAKGTIDLLDVQFADTNRAGAPQNLGDWTVTTPAGFNLASVSPGNSVSVGVNSTTFDVANHIISAVTLTVLH